MEEYVEIAGRMGLSPVQRCATDANCPDVFILDDGRFAIIGYDATDELRPVLPADAGVGPGERIVIVDAATMTHAARDVIASSYSVSA
jgi:hypothetical protein